MWWKFFAAFGKNGRAHQNIDFDVRGMARHGVVWCCGNLCQACDERCHMQRLACEPDGTCEARVQDRILVPKIEEEVGVGFKS